MECRDHHDYSFFVAFKAPRLLLINLMSFMLFLLTGFSRFFDREFSPFALFSFEGKIYGELGFWLKACRTAEHDIC